MRASENRGKSQRSLLYNGLKCTYLSLRPPLLTRWLLFGFCCRNHCRRHAMIRMMWWHCRHSCRRSMKKVRHFLRIHAIVRHHGVRQGRSHVVSLAITETIVLHSDDTVVLLSYRRLVWWMRSLDHLMTRCFWHDQECSSALFYFPFVSSLQGASNVSLCALFRRSKGLVWWWSECVDEWWWKMKWKWDREIQKMPEISKCCWCDIFTLFLLIVRGKRGTTSHSSYSLYSVMNISIYDQPVPPSTLNIEERTKKAPTTIFDDDHANGSTCHGRSAARDLTRSHANWYSTW